MKINKLIIYILLIALVITIIIIIVNIMGYNVKEEKPTLKIGYLPITHAALPLIVHAQTQGELEHFNLDMIKFSNWAEMAEAIQEFVDKLIQAGIWAEENREKAAKLIAPYLGQKPETILHAMNEPEGRTKYIDLYPREEEYEAFQDYMLKIGLMEKGIDIKEFVDERFAEKAYEKYNLEKQEW